MLSFDLLSVQGNLAFSPQQIRLAYPQFRSCTYCSITTSMMCLGLRYLWIIFFAIWQGGFMFYGAIVVPVGTMVLGSESLQGFVTQSVTNYLNIIGFLSLIIWLGELILQRDTLKIRRNIRWAILILLIVMIGLLSWLHIRLDQLLDAETYVISNSDLFIRLHSWYLIISTIQWAFSLVLVGLTIWAWRDAQLFNSKSR